MSALISDCGTYRYTLTRHTPQVVRWVKPVLFILLNPSIADAVIPDPTLTRCVGFANSWVCTELTIVNLFALISTDPKGLCGHPDPVGPDNDKHIAEQIEKHKLGRIVLGWGNTPKFAEPRIKRVRELLNGRPAECLVRNKTGSPKHPLYCLGSLQGIEYVW